MEGHLGFPVFMFLGFGVPLSLVLAIKEFKAASGHSKVKFIRDRINAEVWNVRVQRRTSAEQAWILGLNGVQGTAGYIPFWGLLCRCFQGLSLSVQAGVYKSLPHQQEIGTGVYLPLDLLGLYIYRPAVFGIVTSFVPLGII